MKRPWIVLFAPLLLVGCATLNRSECNNADWNMIGLEDGLKGLPSSNIGNHRRACAKHNITPELDEYRHGHEEGVRQFCTPAKGFEMGKRGVHYNNVCPPDLEPLFLESYDEGNELRRLTHGIESDQSQLRELKKDLDEKEDQLIRSGTEGERARLLEDIKKLQRKIEGLKDRIQDQSADLRRMGY